VRRARSKGWDRSGGSPPPPVPRGLLLGDGAFETVLTLNGRPVWLQDHLDRLMPGISFLGLRADRAALEREALAACGPGLGILRLTVARGGCARGLAAGGTGEAVVLAGFTPLPYGIVYAPVRLAVSTVRRNEGSPSSRMKTLSYLDNILAAREAASRGADEALMLNNSGRVACAGIGNIFILRGSTLVTPPGSEGVLAGIARKHVLACAPGLGLEPREEPLGVGELMRADAVFMTNSLRLINPVTELDGAELNRAGAGTVERLFSMLRAGIIAETSCDPFQPAEPLL
jgi:branched-chain amino acid aminotransferase